MTIPCEFNTSGCTEKPRLRDKEGHEKSCKYRPFICPNLQCDLQLAPSALLDHLTSAHSVLRCEGPEIKSYMVGMAGLYFSGAWSCAWAPRLITSFGRTFFDMALTRDRLLHHWVWFLGEEEEARQYRCEITAFKENTRLVSPVRLTWC